MPHAFVNGVGLYYEERGAGAPVVGVHGAGSSALFWEEAAATLAGRGRAIIYDRRGCLRSERPEDYEVTTVSEHAEDTLALLRALDAEPAVLVGRSYGGTIALELALRHPASVLGIALLEAGLQGLAAPYDAWFASLLDAAELAAAEHGTESVGGVVTREILGAWEELPRAWRDVFTTNGPALLAELRGGEVLSDGLRLGSLAVPALIVGAEQSPEPIQLLTEALERALPDARSVRVGGGHAIDPAGPEVLAFVGQVLAKATRT